MKPETLMDIIFCVLVMPGMMSLFPLGEWIGWHPGYVFFYGAWMYGVWLLCRKALGPLLLQGLRGRALAAASVFLLGVLTFLFSLTPVRFPDVAADGGFLRPHVQAMWALLLCTLSYALPVGALSARNERQRSAREQEQALDDAREALETRRAEGGGGEILIKAGYKTLHVPVSAIRYVEGRNNYACFHLDHRDDIVSQIPLKDVLALLPEGKFARIHRSYIVPLWRIEKRSGTQVQLMGVETPLPVGRAYKDQLKNG